MQPAFWKTTFIYGLGFLGLRMISFLLLPLYTHLLSPSDTGVVFIVYTVLAFLNTVYSRGMDSALIKFYDNSKQPSIISTSILYSIKHAGVLCALLLMIIWVCSLWGLINLSVFSNIIILGLLLVLFFDMLSSRCMTVLRLQERPFYYLFASFTSVVSNLLLNIYLIKYLNMGLQGALWAIIVASIIQIIIFSPLIIFNVRFNVFDSELLIKMKGFSLPFLPAAIFLILIELSDRWMIGLMSGGGTADVGLYGTGYKFGSVIMLCVRAFNLNWQPYYLKHNTQTTFYKVGSLFLSILIILSTLIAIIWPVFFAIFIGEAYWEGGAIIPIVAISYIFYGLFILQMPSLYLKDKERWAPVFLGAGFIVNIISNCFLIPLYGYYGAAVATLFAYFVMALFLVYKNYTWMPMAYSAAHLGLIALLSVVGYGYIYYLRIAVETPINIATYMMVLSLYLISTFPILFSMQKKL